MYATSRSKMRLSLLSDDDRSCRFLLHHWVYGDLVRVYDQQKGLDCTLDWVQVASNVTGVTSATLKVK